MGEDLVDIYELMKLLGYSDERSIKKWCKARGIPIVILGLKKYVLQHLLTQYIDNQLVIFDKERLGKKQPPETSEKTKLIGRGSYEPNNAIISKYLAKYESRDKSQAAKKR